MVNAVKKNIPKLIQNSQKWSKPVNNSQISSNKVKTVKNSLKQPIRYFKKIKKRSKTVKNCLKIVSMVKNIKKRSKTVKNCKCKYLLCHCKCKYLVSVIDVGRVSVCQATPQDPCQHCTTLPNTGLDITALH